MAIASVVTVATLASLTVASPAVAATRTPAPALVASVTSSDHPRFESFVASATQVTENAPYSVLTAQLDTPLASGYVAAVYDDTGVLTGSCSSGSTCTVRVRPGEGSSRSYQAWVVQGTPPSAGGPPPIVYANSIAIRVTNAGWVATVAFDSFVASATQVTENAPMTYLTAQLDGPLSSGFSIAVYDDTGMLVGSCNSGSRCTVLAGVAEGATRVYTAYVVRGTPAANGGPANVFVTSTAITVTNTGWEAGVTDKSQPRIDSLTVMTPVVHKNTPWVYVTADLNKASSYPFWVAVYDDAGDLVGSCHSGYAPPYDYDSRNSCQVQDDLVEGESHTYTAYLTTSQPATSGGPGLATIGASVTSEPVTGGGWSVAGIAIDSLTVMTPVVHKNTPWVYVTADLDKASSYPFWVAVYDDAGDLVGSCHTNYPPPYDYDSRNSCQVQDDLVEGESHTYTAYLTTSQPATSGGPGSATIGASVTSEPVIGGGWSVAGIAIDSLTVMTPVVHANSSSVYVAADLNKNSSYPYWVAVYDDAGDLVGSCHTNYPPPYDYDSRNSCQVQDSLVEGESHTYTAYLTTSQPATRGGPGSAIVGASVTSALVTGGGWNSAGITIDSLAVMTPVVHDQWSWVQFIVDLNRESYYPFWVGVYSDDGQLARSCHSEYSEHYDESRNLCWVNAYVDLSHTKTYTAYLTRSQPPIAGPPSDSIARSESVSVSISTGPTSLAETAGGSNPSQNCTDACSVDPVNTRTGEFWESSADLSVAGVGAPLALQRSFSTTLKDVDNGFGYGWSSAYDMGLSVSSGASGSSLATASKVDVRQENGSVLAFSRTGDGSFAAPARVLATLVANNDGTFTFTRRQSQVYVFSAQGVLLRAQDRNGQGVDLAYDSAGHLVGVQNGRGGRIDLTWTDGRVASASDQAGRVVTYSYSTAGDLTAVALPDGSSLGYAYDSGHRVVSMTAADGGQTTNVYDSSNRVVSQTDPLGRTTTFSYAAGATTVTAPDGSVTIDLYVDGQIRSQTQAAGTASEATTYFAYGASNQVVATTDPLGRTTWFSYDERGNRTSVTDALGRTSTTTYDEWNNPLTVTDAAGQTTTFAYDEHGNLTSQTDPTGAVRTFTVNPDGTIATSIDPLGRTTSFTYDEHGFAASVTGPDGSTVVTSYDSVGRLLSTTDPRGTAAGANAAAYTSTFTYDAAGRRLTATDPLGAVVAAAYDAAGRAVSATDALGATTTRQYDLAGQLVAVTDAAGGSTTMEYDAGGRVTKVTDAGGASTTTAYDVLGRPTAVTDALGRVTRTEYDAAGQVTATVAPSGGRTTYLRDAAGQLVSTTNPLGAVTSTTYDAAGRPVTVTDADGRAVSSTYDGAGRVHQITRADGSVLTWTYDAAGQNTAFTDAAGQVTTYTYDLAGRVASSTDSAGRVTTYTYDRAGLVTGVTLPDGQYADYTYDAAGRRTGTDYSDTTPDVHTTYDAAGRAVSTTDGTGTTEHTYDPLGRTVGVVHGSTSVGYAYDAVGRLTALTYPSGQQVGYTYDAAGQLTGVSDWAGRHYTYTWTPDGQVASVTYPNGVVTRDTYDTAGQATATSAENAGGVKLLELAYSYDDAGQLTSQSATRSVQDRAPPTVTTTTADYTYDPLARLATITGTGAGSVGFDTAGRLTALADGRTLAYDTAGQATALTDPVANTASTYTYDSRGNRTTAITTAQSGTQTVTTGWNLANQLTSYATSDQATTYAYDAAGLRTSASTRTGATTSTEQYTWDTTASVPLLLTDGSASYIYGAGTTPIAQVDNATGDITYLHHDLIGSVRTATDATGQVVCDADYDPYGKAVAVTADACGAVTRFGYAGQYTDPTGLIYLRARYYDPATAQFLSVDPLLDTTRNPYGYTSGNPLQFTDPLGLDAWQDAGDWSAAFGDTVTFGLTRWVRTKLGVDGVVNYCSDFYTWGGYGGQVANVGLMFTGVGEVGQATAGTGRIGTYLAMSTNEAGRTAVAAADARIAAEAAGDTPYLYRGLAADHPALGDAANGIARPRGGHSNPALHNGGNTMSEFTSWTTEESIARDIAAEANGPGTVLRIPNADGAGYVRVPSPDVYGESEVLIRGPVTGADVLPWEPR